MNIEIKNLKNQSSRPINNLCKLILYLNIGKIKISEINQGIKTFRNYFTMFKSFDLSNF